MHDDDADQSAAVRQAIGKASLSIMDTIDEEMMDAATATVHSALTVLALFEARGVHAMTAVDFVQSLILGAVNVEYRDA